MTQCILNDITFRLTAIVTREVLVHDFVFALRKDVNPLDAKLISAKLL